MSVVESSASDSVQISVNTELCKGCEICVSQCPTDVFEMQGNTPERYPAPTNITSCVDCGICELICPDFALEVEAV